MIDPEEFIRGEYFPHVCDMRVGTEVNLPYAEQLEVPDKEHVSIYAKTENLSAAMDVIRLIQTICLRSSPITATCWRQLRNAPANLHRWFAQNRGIDRDGVYSLPIGLENEHWFPYKQQIMLETKPEEPRIAKLLLSLIRPLIQKEVTP